MKTFTEYKHHFFFLVYITKIHIIYAYSHNQAKWYIKVILLNYWCNGDENEMPIKIFHSFENLKGSHLAYIYELFLYLIAYQPPWVI